MISLLCASRASICMIISMIHPIQRRPVAETELDISTLLKIVFNFFESRSSQVKCFGAAELIKNQICERQLFIKLNVYVLSFDLTRDLR